MFNMRQLEAFIATINAGSMTDAANWLNTSQPSISRFIADLEIEVGFSLFERASGRIRPTPEALEFFNHVNRFQESGKILQQRTEEIRNYKHGQLRIGSNSAAALGIVPQALASIIKMQPEIRIDYQVRSSQTVCDLVASQQLDIGIVSKSRAIDGITCEAEYQWECVVVLQKDHPAASHKSINLDNLEGQNLIAYGDDYMAMNLVSTELREKMDNLVKIKTPLSYSACSLVTAGIGVALIDPLTAQAWEIHGLVARPFKPAIPYNISIVRSALVPSSRVTTQFSKELQSVIDQQSNSKLSPFKATA